MHDDDDAPAERPDSAAPGFPVLQFDYEVYRPYFEGDQLSEREKRDLAETLWMIMLGFVDMGFHIQTAPRAEPGAGVGKTALARDSRRMIACKDTFKNSANNRRAAPVRVGKRR